MYREVTMIEVSEVLRLWQEHLPKKRIAAQLGLDPKTVRVFDGRGRRVEAKKLRELLNKEVVGFVAFGVIEHCDPLVGVIENAPDHLHARYLDRAGTRPRLGPFGNGFAFLLGPFFVGFVARALSVRRAGHDD